MGKSFIIGSIILGLIFLGFGCGANDKKEALTGIELLYQEFEKAERAELINIVGQKVGEIQSEKMKELIMLLRKTKPGPYPEGNTGGEIEGAIILIYPNKRITLVLAATYLAISEPEIKKYGIKESHLVFNSEISSEDFERLFK